MRVAGIIEIAVCLVLTAISASAQEQRYELSEAKVAPGFYLAPNGYEYQLPQYGLTITIPPQSYYKVPYLLKHNAYLVTNNSVVSYCLYKFYLSNSYTDFALYGSYNGNMRYRVAEFKNNDKQEFFEGLKKKRDYSNHRSLRTPFATFTHYSALSDASEGRAHGYYYLSDNILIEFIVMPRDQQELAKCEDIIKTLRKVDLQKDLNEYLMMLAALQSTVPGEEVDTEVKEEEEVEVLYAQELATPVIAPKPSSPFAEPIPQDKTVNAEKAKNTSELAAMLRAGYASKSSEVEEEENIEVVDVKIAESKDLVVYKDGFIKPPEVEWVFNVQPVQLSAFSLAKAQQKPIRQIDGILFPIYAIVKRPDAPIENISVPQSSLVLANNLQAIYPTSAAKIEKSLLAIRPVVKQPNISIGVDVPESVVMLASNRSLDTSTATAEKTLISTITPVVKKPDVAVEIDDIESTSIVTAPVKDITSSASSAEKTLLAIASVEKRPEVSVDIEIAEATDLSKNAGVNLNTSAGAAGNMLTSTITEVVKQPEPIIDIAIKQPQLTVNANSILLALSSSKIEQSLALLPIEKHPVYPGINIEEETSSATITVLNNVSKDEIQEQKEIKISDVQAGSAPVFVVTGEFAEKFWDSTESTNPSTTVQQPKLVDLTIPSNGTQKAEKKIVKPTIVSDVNYQEFTQSAPKKEVVNFEVVNTIDDKIVALTPNKAANAEIYAATKEESVEQQPAASNKRGRCSRAEDEIILTKIEEAVIPYSKVQQKPTFNGGDYNSFAYWIGDNMCYPEGLRQELDGYVDVEMTIGSDGSIGNIKVTKSPHKLLEAEILYMLSTSPKWNPGVQDGKPVAVSVVVGVPVSAYL